MDPASKGVRATAGIEDARQMRSLVLAGRVAWITLMFPFAAVSLALLGVATTPLLLYQMAAGKETGPADRLADFFMPRWTAVVTPWEARRA